jgi:hypothetical protein
MLELCQCDQKNNCELSITFIVISGLGTISIFTGGIGNIVVTVLVSPVID